MERNISGGDGLAGMTLLCVLLLWASLPENILCMCAAMCVFMKASACHTGGIKASCLMLHNITHFTCVVRHKANKDREVLVFFQYDHDCN